MSKSIVLEPRVVWVTQERAQYVSFAASLDCACISACTFTKYLCVAQWRSRAPLSLGLVDEKTLALQSFTNLPGDTMGVHVLFEIRHLKMKI
jgi:hypothetical protein